MLLQDSPILLLLHLINQATMLLPILLLLLPIHQATLLPIPQLAHPIDPIILHPILLLLHPIQHPLLPTKHPLSPSPLFTTPTPPTRPPPCPTPSPCTGLMYNMYRNFNKRNM